METVITKLRDTYNKIDAMQAAGIIEYDSKTETQTDNPKLKRLIRKRNKEEEVMDTLVLVQLRVIYGAMNMECPANHDEISDFCVHHIVCKGTATEWDANLVSIALKALMETYCSIRHFKGK